MKNVVEIKIIIALFIPILLMEALKFFGIFFVNNQVNRGLLFFFIMLAFMALAWCFIRFRAHLAVLEEDSEKLRHRVFRSEHEQSLIEAYAKKKIQSNYKPVKLIGLAQGDTLTDSTPFFDVSVSKSNNGYSLCICNEGAQVFDVDVSMTAVDEQGIRTTLLSEDCYFRGVDSSRHVTVNFKPGGKQDYKHLIVKLIYMNAKLEKFHIQYRLTYVSGCYLSALDDWVLWSFSRDTDDA